MSVNNFKLTLDTISPTGTITYPTTLVNVKNTITVRMTLGSDEHAAQYMKVWYDTHNQSWYTSQLASYTIAELVGDSTKYDNNNQAVASTATAAVNAPWVLADTSYQLSFTASGGGDLNGSYYAHVVLLDDVGNYSNILHSANIISDTQSPLVGTIYAYDLTNTGTASNPVYSHEYTNEAEFGFYLQVKDTGTTMSGINRVTITGALTDTTTLYFSDLTGSGEWSTWSGHLTFNSSAQHSPQTIRVTVYDNSGNSSYKECSIIYDPDPATGEFRLKPTAASTSLLKNYLNYADNEATFVAVINLNDSTITNDIIESDVVKYRIWGDLQGKTTQVDYDWPQHTVGAGTANEHQESDSSVTVTGLKFTNDQDSLTKTVNVQLIDRAGNITTLTPQTRCYDATKPTATISSNQVAIAAGSGSINAATISYTAADATAGIATGYPKFYCNNSEISGVLGLSGNSTNNGSFTFKNVSGANDNTPGAIIGNNTIKIVVVDNAGNSYETTCVVNVEASFTINALQLPVVTPYMLYEGIYKAVIIDNSPVLNYMQLKVYNTTAPTSGRSKLYIWTDNISDNTTVPVTAQATPTTWSTSPQTVQNDAIAKQIVWDSNNNYVHVKAVSNVGNIAYAHLQFIADKTAPTFTTISPQYAHTPALNNNIIISASDDGSSGLDAIKIIPSAGTPLSDGAITTWTSFESGSGNFSVVLARPDPADTNSFPTSKDYSVVVYIRDKANNETSQVVTWEYDRIAPAGSLALKEVDGTTTKQNPSALNAFIAQITFSDVNDSDATDDFNDVEYIIWGDCATSDGGTALVYDELHPENTTATWTRFTADTVLTPVLYCTDNPDNAPADGVEKFIHIKIRDDAGNLSSTQTASFVYNPATAELVISNLTHNRISCSHVQRKTGGDPTPVAAITGDYADKVSFTVSCKQTIQEWKVAAFTVFPNNGNEVRGDSVMPMVMREQGSSTSGYHQSGVAVTSWTVQVDGQDYRNAIRSALGAGSTAEVDGTYYIIVFGKNLAGVWSVAGTAATELELLAMMAS